MINKSKLALIAAVAAASIAPSTCWSCSAIGRAARRCWEPHASEAGKAA